MMRSKKSLMIAATLLVVLALAFAGCGGGGGGGSNDGGSGNGPGNGGGGGNGGSGGGGIEDFNVFVGVWKSVKLNSKLGGTLTVTLKVDEPYVDTFERETIEIGGKVHIRDGIFFPGRVECDNFDQGYLNIAGKSITDKSKRYMFATIIRNEKGQLIGKTIHVRTTEDTKDDYGHDATNELDLDGELLTDNDVLHVVRLYITRKFEDLIDFDSDDDSFLPFTKE